MTNTHILLRSSWQTVNIGDIGHTPGVLRLLEDHFPDAIITLWASEVGEGVGEMIQTRFPKLSIIQEERDIQKAFKECDFFLHGSGPSLVAETDVRRWQQETGKPYGVFGITVSEMNDALCKTLSEADFVYFRDSVSLNFAIANKVQCPVMEFGPDGAFSVDLRDDESAEKFLSENNLEEGKFLCCIPKFRLTPYWLIHDMPFNSERHELNQRMKEDDISPLREAVIEVVRQTNLKILLCPEDQTQMAINKEMIYDKLPEDVKGNVVWQESFWLTDQALSTFVRSAGLFGLEMHSPIMCIANGIPAIVCRFEEQTSKGFMWQDIGLDEWLFDMDISDQINKIVPAVLEMAKKPEIAFAKAAQAGKTVVEFQNKMIEILTKSLKK